ncbi:MAG: hypothetical protein HC917_10730 [Richelia sp. SM2_1_7]|nr:hypothetical protein [Richelia sp. SM2_1_7]
MKNSELFLLINKINLIAVAILLVLYQNLPAYSQTNSSTEKNQNNYPAIFKITPESDNNIKRLMLKDVVVLVLANNTEIKNAYLDRTVQKEN